MNTEDKKKRISELPSGGITIKRAKNKETGTVYEYHVYQWRENGKQKSRYLKDSEIQELSALIEERKLLVKELAGVENVVKIPSVKDEPEYITNVQTGESLKFLVESVNGLKKREIIKYIEDYVYGDEPNRVFILYGLRRTGKTTMIKQLIFEMSDAVFEKTAFIQINSSNDLGQLNRDLRSLFNAGFRYVFIDEVTLMEDFIEGASLLSDIYAASGMKLVLSGTDSLGFWFSEKNELYDRCLLLHTTFIPYREFERVLGIKGVDEYIKYGGTMSMSGKYYNIFSDKDATDEYVDSAIAHNIQHSLRCYQDGGHFRHLYSLYERDELTSTINRVVEDINHRFTVEVLTREFKSGDLALSARNIRRDNNVLDLIDRDAVTSKLKNLLEIKNKPEQKVEIDSVHEREIKEYLVKLDLIREIPIKDIEAYGQNEIRNVFTQAGLRYSQAKALVDVLMQDKVFGMLSFSDRKYVTQRILNEIKGRMLEDIVLLETCIAKPDKDVFKLQFSDGEYDMVVFDKENGGCLIYEIKYSELVDPHQYRHLVDEEKLQKTEFQYGEILGKYVLYRGKPQMAEGVQYMNIEEYLMRL